MFRLCAYLLLLPLFCQAQPTLQPLPISLPCRYGVIGLRVEPAGPDTLRVSRLVPGSPAFAAGLRPGDLLLGALPYRLRTRDELSRYVQSRPPGDSLLLILLRQGQFLALSCRVTDRRQLFSSMAAQGIPLPSLDQPQNQGWDGNQDSLERGTAQLLRRHQSTADLTQLVAALALEDSSYGADCRLSTQRYALLHPLKAGQIAGDLAARFLTTDLDSLLLAATTALDLELPSKKFATPPPSLPDQLQPFFRAGPLVLKAMASLDSAQQQELRGQIPLLLESLSRNPDLDLSDSTQDLRRTLGLAKAVDLTTLFAAARELTSLCTPASLRALQTAARRADSVATSLPPGLSGRLLYAQPSPLGWIVVGDRGPNHYEGPIALVLDLGGDDTYTLTDPLPVRLCIDYQGDDQYRGPVGAGLAGVSLNVDLAGDDLYLADQLAQGSAFCGVGLLIDRQGRDQYQAGEYAQGAAFFGAGILLDEAGDDQYGAAQHSQGFGSTRGLGLLRDRRGADQYAADLQVPSAYGDPGLYEGWSQGMGCGIRGYGEGGIGLLLELSGDDRYQGGNFSQGVGYFFGLGALVDQGGNDRYLGSRYAQGAAAHQAVGILVDHTGNDRYQSRVAAGQGSGWDAAVGVLIDEHGDDQYRADDLSQGAGAMNGLGLLLDQRGNDSYQTHSGQGAGGSLEYWGGRNAPNLGVLMDWGGKDRYNLEGRRNQAEFKNSGIGLFEDR
ncbi:MAG: PDZ domain-containing protein [Candidatus Latescibacteria bacterium]|nr:PDZ domain-containing protein [Candidatus Latescibacterota bacterium]